MLEDQNLEYCKVYLMPIFCPACLEREYSIEVLRVLYVLHENLVSGHFVLMPCMYIEGENSNGVLYPSMLRKR
jgi:hypothetical protein